MCYGDGLSLRNQLRYTLASLVSHSVADIGGLVESHPDRRLTATRDAKLRETTVEFVGWKVLYPSKIGSDRGKCNMPPPKVGLEIHEVWGEGERAW